MVSDNKQVRHKHVRQKILAPWMYDSDAAFAPQTSYVHSIQMLRKRRRRRPTGCTYWCRRCSCLRRSRGHSTHLADNAVNERVPTSRVTKGEQSPRRPPAVSSPHVGVREGGNEKIVIAHPTAFISGRWKNLAPITPSESLRPSGAPGPRLSPRATPAARVLLGFMFHNLFSESRLTDRYIHCLETQGASNPFLCRAWYILD